MNDHFAVHTSVVALWCTPETNMVCVIIHHFFLKEKRINLSYFKISKNFVYTVKNQ